jgi:hypothetical protein
MTARNLKEAIRAYGEAMRITPPGDIQEALEVRALAEIDVVIDALYAHATEDGELRPVVGGTTTIEGLPPGTIDVMPGGFRFTPEEFTESPNPTRLTPKQADAILDDYARRHPPCTPRPVPEYPHTCKECQFLGRYTPDAVPEVSVDAIGRVVSRQFYARADLYICCPPELRGPQKIVSRYGPSPGDCTSMAVESLRAADRVQGCNPARDWPAHVEGLRLYDAAQAQVVAIENGGRYPRKEY